MHAPDRTKIFAALLTLALLLSSLPLRAQDGQPHTRPRRASAPPVEEAAAPEPRAEQERPAGEPVVRIGLAINARSVTVSTTGRLLTTIEPDAAPTPLEI